MSQEINNERLHHLTYTIAGKIGEGAQKTESIFSSASIYRVPEELCKLKENAYTPRIIAIGPLHRNDKHLQTPLQHVKMSYTDYLLSRLTAGMENVELEKQEKLMVLNECLSKMTSSIGDAKKCYEAEVTLDEEMMLVDGCFIPEFLYKHRTLKEPETDPVFSKTLTLYKVMNDLVLLENQIPFFVLEKLFHLTVERIPDRPDKNWSLTEYVGWCYRRWMSPLANPLNSSSTKSTWCFPSVLKIFGYTAAAPAPAVEEEFQNGNIDKYRTAKYYHILHKLHDDYLPPDQTKQEESVFREMPSASELVYAGVKFVPSKGRTANTLFKIKFTEPKGIFWWCHRSRFEIPPLGIYDHTETYLRNLIALEMCCPGISKYVSTYAIVMDTLMNTDKDVQVLEKAGVLRNQLGATEDATHLFNNLCKEIKYSMCFWPSNMAHMRHTYFVSWWTFITFCVVFIAFAISLVEFVCDFVKEG